MFITNILNPGEMLAEHLKGVRVAATATEAFAALKHDKDLCPHFRSQIASMLDAYKAYGQEAHDIQSFRDDGVDILLKYEDKDGRERKAGIQIKSEGEFQQWEDGKLSLIQILKGQYATAIANARLDEYFIVLCVDAVRHRKRIRTLCSEFKNFCSCEIIEPTDVFDFYYRTSIEVWARTTSLLCANDRVLDAAIEEANSLKPDEAFFLITLLCRALGNTYVVSQELLYDIWDAWEEFAGDNAGSPDRLSDILGMLEGRLFITDDGGGESFTLQVCHLPAPLCALYFDLKVRATEPSWDLADEIFALTGLKDRLKDETENEQEES
jgi:hypothetical protein